VSSPAKAGDPVTTSLRFGHSKVPLDSAGVTGCRFRGAWQFV